MTSRLIFVGISGSRVGQSTVFSERSSSIGSDQRCTVVLPDPSILPRHAEVRTTLERWFILPLDPKAAIFINGKPVTGQQRIDAGDLVTVGGATFKVALGEAERAVGGPKPEAPPPNPEEFWRD